MPAVGCVCVAEDQDFAFLKRLADETEKDGWKLEYSKNSVKVWMKPGCNSNFKIIKLCGVLSDVPPSLLFDVLHDPNYRKEWDTHMIESFEIGYLNPNNDIGYYALKCPPPLKNRDFVVQRSWLDAGNEYLVLNHSVFHEKYPPRKGFVRATSYITGYIIRPSGENDSELWYVSQTDPRGKLPPWLVNKVTHIFAPQMIKRLKIAAHAYGTWKALNSPHWKPWINPEQIIIPRINLREDCNGDGVLSCADHALLLKNRGLDCTSDEASKKKLYEDLAICEQDPNADLPLDLDPFLRKKQVSPTG
ncbi:unnamed protein product, partial [Notodromas monacha]